MFFPESGVFRHKNDSAFKFIVGPKHGTVLSDFSEDKAVLTSPNAETKSNEDGHAITKIAHIFRCPNMKLKLNRYMQKKHRSNFRLFSCRFSAVVYLLRFLVDLRSIFAGAFEIFFEVFFWIVFIDVWSIHGLPFPNTPMMNRAFT